MMNHPSKEQFRLLANIGISFILAGTLMDTIRFPEPTQEESMALDWNYWGAIVPYSVQIGIWWSIGLSTLIGLIGFMLFQAWSRWLLLGAMIFNAITSPLLGLFVARGLSEGMVAIGGLLLLFPLVLSFFPPCCDYYNTTPIKCLKSKSQ